MKIAETREKSEIVDQVIHFPAGHYSSAEKFLGIIRNSASDLSSVEYEEHSEIEIEANLVPNDRAFAVEMFSSTDHRLRITL